MCNALTRHIPNAITCLNLVCGTVAIVLAMDGDWATASAFIGAAAVFDFLDGAMARMLHAYSPVGKELDSLSDLVSFGVAPALMVYKVLPAPLCWLAVMIAVCGALRLARFNVDTRQTTEFIGLPIPANAIFWIGAVSFLHTGADDSMAMAMDHAAMLGRTLTVAVAIVAVSLLMLAPIRIFSLKFKNFSLADNWMRYLAIALTVCAVAILGLPGLAVAIALYVLLACLYNIA